MFEVVKRLTKFLRYVFLAIASIMTISWTLLDRDGMQCLMFGLTCIGIFEALSRALVWIVSGYFEANPNAGISSKDLRQMQEYYSFSWLRKKMQS